MIARVQTALLTLTFAAGLAQPAQSAQRPTAYPQMAAIAKYLSPDRSAEIALARSAAPPAIARNATVLVLARDGYHVAARGTNGFTCLVERGWVSPFDSTDFWNPKLRGPICYNPAAVRSILPYTINRTRLALAGVSKARMHAAVVSAVAGGALPLPAPGAMSYMMAKSQYLGDGIGHWYPHLMFHVRATASSWGANAAGSPVMFDDYHHDFPEPETILMIAVPHWSDGTPAPPGM